MKKSAIDRAQSVRPGEELPQESLKTYLLSLGLIEVGEPLEIEQFPSGFSNLTYLLKTPSREMVLRRPPFGAEKISKGHDMGREYKVLKALYPVYKKIPQPLHLEEGPSLLGGSFYLMERVKGIIVRSGKELEADETTIRKVGLALVESLAELHQIDLQKTNLIQLGKAEGYLQRQVSGWIKRYKHAQTDELADMEMLMEWLPANQPASHATAFIHNDFKLDNVVLHPKDPTRIIAVLDWEMATVGDPLADLGTLLAYTVEKGDAPALYAFSTKLPPGMLHREDIIEAYRQRSTHPVENMIFYYAFALFKLGVIGQQIYYRYRQGDTQDPRFAQLIELVKSCAGQAATTIQYKRIRDFN